MAEIDSQLSRGPVTYLNQTINAAPLAFCALGMIAGIILQDKINLNILFWLLALALCLVSFFVLLFFIKVNRVFAGAFLAVTCFVCLGAIRLAKFNQPGPDDIRNSVGSDPNLASVRGVIATVPFIDGRNWRFAQFAHTDRGSSFYLQVRNVESVDGWVNASGLVRVHVNEPVLDLKAGDYIQMFCWLDRYGPATNPGEFDIASYLARKGVSVAASVESRDAIEQLKAGNIGLFSKAKTALRRFVVLSFLGAPYPRDEQESLLLALVLGYRENIDPDTIKAFRQTGLLHFICLSGMNFAIVIWFIWWICKTAGLMKPARALVCILAAILFLLVVPENPPAFRAAVMCFAFCGAFIFRRKSNPFNALALAALTLLFIRPTGLFEPDWQLSFVSVLGILLFAKPIESFLRGKFPGWLSSSFSVSLSAWLASAGILLYHFGSFQWLTSVWTVLVSPLIELISILGYSKLVVALLSPSAADAMGVIINFLARWLIIIVKVIAGFNISEILIGSTDASVIILYYAIIIYVFFFNFSKPFLKKIVCSSAIILLIALLLLPEWQKSYRGSLNLTILDVGHGQAIMAQLPGQVNLLFDSGSSTRNDIGTRVVGPFLRYNGLRSVDALVISHGDIDHINGIPEVAQNTRTKGVYASDAFLNDVRPTVNFLNDELLQKVRTINDLPQEFGPAAIKVLWPVKDVFENNSISENDKAMVTMIEYAQKRILICSDIEKFAQGEILNLYPDLKADVLIAPHHGSAKTLQREFLEAIQPQVVICSCAKSACEKRQVINCGEEFRSFYTGTDGAITIRINEDGSIEANAFIAEK